MDIRIMRVVMAMMVVAILGGCESKTGDGQAQAEAPAATKTEAPAQPGPEPDVATNVPRDTYAPDGLDGATVTIKPLGKALISVVGGYPVRVYEGASEGEYRQARLTPGDYILHVGNIEARQGLNLNFHGEAGDYYALALTYAVEGELFWTPVIVSGSPNGPIAADKDGLLVGKTQAEAVRLLTASSNRPATAGQAEAEDAQKKVDDAAQRKQAAEAKARALFDKGLKAYEANRMEEALQALDEALMIAPNFDSALALRGSTLGRLKKPKSALESLDKAIRIGRNNRGVDDEWLHWPLLEKGLILAVARKPDLADEAFSESIRVKPTVKALIARANLNFVRGQLLGNKDDWDGAAPYFKRAQADAEKGIELEPKSDKFWSIKTGTHIMLNEHEQACSAMRKACDLGNCSILEQYPQCKPGGF
ncbi:MAG: tetratricopeptide repeat protein [Proteobacteria bacterium]|nr:tetratricopeptide repeat protein [Pseudomonadota bacterium]